MTIMENKIKVLAVDDEKFNLMLLKGCLKADQYEIVGCTNAVDALQEYKKQYFDVLLLDVLMPGIDGFELRKLIRGIDKEKPIIFLTALVDDVNTTMLNQISWDPYTYYMNKSYSKKLLSNKIEQAVEVYRSKRMMESYYNKLETEMDVAGDLQKLLLPDWCVLNKAFCASFIYLPCAKVSGDIYELFQIYGDKYLFFVGDIAGHGMQAALYMAAVQSFLKVAAAGKDVKPHNLLNQLNSFFCNELGSGTYMTCLVAVVDFGSNHISIQSAGHPGLVGCSANNEKVWQIGDHNKGGMPIGWFAENKYTEDDTSDAVFEDDTVIIGCSDGLMDLTNKDNVSMSDDDRNELIGMLSVSSDVITIPYRIMKSMEQIGFDHNPDDVCVVAFKKQLKNEKLIIKRIPPQISNVSKTAIEFSNFIQEKTGNLELAAKIELLISEYLNNVIIHGMNSKQSSKNIICMSLMVDEHDIVLRGLDRGKIWEFSPNTNDVNADGGSSAGNAATSGRGLQIIRDITDHVTHDTYYGLNETVFYVKY